MTLRPHTGVNQCALVPDVCHLSVDGWCVTLSETGVSCVGGTLMLYVYSVQPRLFRFSRCRLSVHHAHSCQVAQGSACPSRKGCIAAPDAYRAWHGAHGLTPFTFGSWHSLQLQAPLFLTVTTCRSLERTQTSPLYLLENLISQHAH